MNSQISPAKNRWGRPIAFALGLAVFAAAYVSFGDQLSLERLAGYEKILAEYDAQHPWGLIAGAFVLYVVVSGLSIPGAAVALSLAYGSYFGWLKAVAIVSFASTAGATVAMLFSRYLFHDFVQQKFGEQLKSLHRNLETDGALYLFSLRLIFVVPFFMLNLLMGLTNMKWTTYWWVSQLGMLPGTMAYVYAGSTFKLQDLAEDGFGGIGWQTLLAFCILGIMPMAISKIMNQVRRADAGGVETQ